VYKAQFSALKGDDPIVITKALFRALHLAGKIPEQAVILIDESAQMAASTVKTYSFEDIARSANIHPNGAQVVAIVDQLKEIAAAQRYAPGGQQLRDKLIESLNLKEIMELNRYYQTEAAALVSNRNSAVAQNAAKAGEHDIADRLFGNEPTIVIEALFQFALGNTETAITLSGDAVTVWKSDPLWSEALGNAALVVVADATQTPESLAPIVGAKPEDIGYLKSTQVAANNIRYTSYVCPGFTGDELSVKALQQVGRVADRHGIDSVLTKKSKLPSVRQACGTDKVIAGSYGRDSRGSNMFYRADSRRLLLAGLPIPNMGAVAARLSVELKRDATHEEISKEMNRITSVEVRQACGRLRANRHPEHQYEVVFLANQEIAWADSTTHLDLEEVAGRQASESVQAYILQSSRHMVQTAIADVLGVSQATVSRRLKDWGEFQVGAAATIALQPVETIQEFLATLGEQATAIIEPTKEIIQWAEIHQETLDPDEEFKFPNIVEMFLSLQDRLRYIPESQWPTPSISNLPTAVALAFETAWAFIKHQWEMADETVAMGTEILVALRDSVTAREIAT
jgi:predicted transcriptional regulator